MEVGKQIDQHFIRSGQNKSQTSDIKQLILWLAALAGFVLIVLFV